MPIEKKAMIGGDSNTGGDAKMASSLRINNLFYKLPRSLSVAVQRSSIKTYPQKSSYRGGQTLVCDFNSGTSFIDTLNSYLTFSMKTIRSGGVAGDGTAGFGVGSVINIINQVKIQSRSGTEIERTEQVNRFALLKTKWTYSSSFLSNFGSVIGFESATDEIADNVEVQFCIPLRLISGLFNPLRSRLMPSMLASGLHVEILLEQSAKALVAETAGVVVDYEISNVYFSLNAVTLMDSVLRTLNAESSANGLEYVYERVFTSENQVAQGTTKSNIQINKAVSFATGLWAIETPNASQTDDDGDSFVTNPYDLKYWRVRSGSSYYPTDGVRSSLAVLSAPISYIETQQSFDKMRKIAYDNSVDLATYLDGKQGTTIVGVSLEKDTSLALSGIPVNNSRLIEIELERETGSPVDSTVSLFLTFTSVVRCYLNNVSSKV